MEFIAWSFGNTANYPKHFCCDSTLYLTFCNVLCFRFVVAYGYGEFRFVVAHGFGEFRFARKLLICVLFSMSTANKTLFFPCIQLKGAAGSCSGSRVPEILQAQGSCNNLVVMHNSSMCWLSSI